VRVGGPEPNGGVASLQSGLYGLGHFGSDQNVGGAEPRSHAAAAGRIGGHDHRHARAEEVAAGPVRADRPPHRSDNEACQSLPKKTEVEPQAKYSLNLGALRKWSKERLRLERLPDASIKASFRYDGTTCSNMGRPLVFHYRVRLAPQAEQYRILELSCAPSPGDVGYQSMCEYLRDAAMLMGKIESEKPLLGRPLQEVLQWQRVSSPSGCYCEPEMRMHKWGLVFEVLHFALARLETEAKVVQNIASRG